MARREHEVPVVGSPRWWSTRLPYQHKVFNYFADRPDDAAPPRSRSGPYLTRWR